MTEETDRNSDEAGQPRPLNFAGRTLTAALITAGVALFLILLWYAADVFLLTFAAVLLAVGLRSLSGLAGRVTKLSESWSLALVSASLLFVFAGAGLLLAPRVSAQVDDLTGNLPQAFEALVERASSYEWSRRIMAEVPPPSRLIKGGGGVLARVTGVFSTALGSLVNVAIVLSVGLYLAADPRLYTSGLLSLVPSKRRPRVREVLTQLGSTLRRWLVGRLVLMVVNAALTWLGLSLLGVPLALTLGLLAGLLNFVPNVGPVVAGVPAVLIALTQSPEQALYVLLLYVVLQSVDGYVFTPLVQKRTVELPPALTITAQVLFGVLLGAAGVVLATPLTAAALVIVRMLYVEGVLDGGRAAEMASGSGKGEIV
jgi:predicted PurR-regulated permease PerM